MNLPRRSVLAALAIAPAAAAAAPVRPRASVSAKVDQVASFDQQVTGVTVTGTGRIFVNFPRWEKDVAISVAEVGPGGKLTPYPNAEWNAWRNGRMLGNGDHFVCVQSVVADKGSLWVLDAAAPGNEFNLAGGPKLVEIDLASNAVRRTIAFGRDVIPQGSYLNDIRFSPDGRWAYITDSGVIGALIVVDLQANTARRLLSGHSSTQVEKDVVVTADGKPLRRGDGRGPMFAADGIALDPKGEYLYWQALTGQTLYRVPAAALTAAERSAEQVAAAVETLGRTCVADGLWMDGKGRLFVTSPSDNSVKLRGADGTLAIVVQDARLRWPDTMSEGPDGTFYVTASHIQDMAQWHPSAVPPKYRTALFSFRV